MRYTRNFLLAGVVLFAFFSLAAFSVSAVPVDSVDCGTSWCTGDHDYCRRWTAAGESLSDAKCPKIDLIECPDVIYWNGENPIELYVTWAANNNKEGEDMTGYAHIYYDLPDATKITPTVNWFDGGDQDTYIHLDDAAKWAWLRSAKHLKENTNYASQLFSGNIEAWDNDGILANKMNSNPEHTYIYVECCAEWSGFFGWSRGTGCGKWVQLRPTSYDANIEVTNFQASFPKEIKNTEERFDVLVSLDLLEDGEEVDSAYTDAFLHYSFAEANLPDSIADLDRYITLDPDQNAVGFGMPLKYLPDSGDCSFTMWVTDANGDEIFSTEESFTILEDTDDGGDGGDSGGDSGGDTNAVPTLNDPSSSISGSSVILTASFDDDGPNPWIIHIDWGDGSTDDVSVAAGNTANKEHTYSSAGGYNIAVTVEDADGATSAQKLEPVTISDDDGGGGDDGGDSGGDTGSVADICTFQGGRAEIVYNGDVITSQVLSLPSGDIARLEWEICGCIGDDFDRVEILYNDEVQDEFTSETGEYSITGGSDSYGAWTIKAYNADGEDVYRDFSILDGGGDDGGDSDDSGGDTGDDTDGDSDDSGGASVGDPTISISLSKSTIVPGEIATLTWSTTDAASLEVTGSGIVDPPSSFTDAEIAMGFLDIRPQSSTTYNFTVTGDNGNVIYKEKTIFVEQPSSGSSSDDTDEADSGFGIDPVLLIGGGIALIFIAFNLVYFQLKKEFPPYYKLIKKLTGKDSKKKVNASGFNPLYSTGDYDIGLSYSGDSSYPKNPYYRSKKSKRKNKNKRKK